MMNLDNTHYLWNVEIYKYFTLSTIHKLKIPLGKNILFKKLDEITDYPIFVEWVEKLNVCRKWLKEYLCSRVKKQGSELCIKNLKITILNAEKGYLIVRIDGYKQSIKGFPLILVNSNCANVISKTIHPAIIDEFIFYHEEKAEIWCDKDEISSFNDKPAVINYYPNSTQIHFVKWFKNGNVYKPFGPASIWYSIDGNITSEIWYKRPNEMHNEKGPCGIWYYYGPKQKPSKVMWSNEYVSKHPNHPTLIEYNINGTVTKKSFE